MRGNLRVSMAQWTSTNRHKGNICGLEAAVETAAKENADLLALPEAAGMMNKNRQEARQFITDFERDPFVAASARLAKKAKLWLHLGSTPVRGSNGRYRNRSVLLDKNGDIRAVYDKIHLFDIFLEGRPPTGESRRYDAGSEAVLVDTPWGPWGMSVCYDLRFPHLYREYSRRGATVLFAPSAFTVPTGRAHWEILLRARAIENGAWVIAAAQVGQHDDGRETYGHSMIVSPWGEVVVDLGGRHVRQTTVDIDMEGVHRARKQIPSIRSERDFTFVRVTPERNFTYSATQ